MTGPLQIAITTFDNSSLERMSKVVSSALRRRPFDSRTPSHPDEAPISLRDLISTPGPILPPAPQQVKYEYEEDMTRRLHTRAARDSRLANRLRRVPYSYVVVRNQSNSGAKILPKYLVSILSSCVIALYSPARVYFLQCVLSIATELAYLAELFCSDSDIHPVVELHADIRPPSPPPRPSIA